MELSKEQMIAEMNEEVKDMTPAEFEKWLDEPLMTFAEWLKTDGDVDSDMAIEMIDVRGKELGIKHTTWSMGIEWLGGMTLPADLMEGAKYIKGANKVCYGCGDGTYWPLGAGHKRPTTYDELWQKIDSMRKRKHCDHRFIEGVSRKGDYIVVTFGS